MGLYFPEKSGRIYFRYKINKSPNHNKLKNTPQDSNLDDLSDIDSCQGIAYHSWESIPYPIHETSEVQTT